MICFGALVVVTSIAAVRIIVNVFGQSISLSFLVEKIFEILQRRQNATFFTKTVILCTKKRVYEEKSEDEQPKLFSAKC